MFTQTSFRDSLSVSDSFNPGLTKRFVWPDQGPNVRNEEDSQSCNKLAGNHDNIKTAIDSITGPLGCLLCLIYRSK